MKVLIVDNTEGFVRDLKQAMEENGCTVQVAGTDGDGERPYDAIVRLGLTPPGQTAPSVPVAEQRSGLTVAELTLTTEVSKANGTATTAVATRGRPDRPKHQRLVASLPDLIKGRLQRQEQVLRVRDLEIDLEERTVQRGGRPIQLTRREFDLLEFLARHRGRVVSILKIWEHFYKEIDEISSNIVAVYIRYLRNKIDKGFSVPLILTRRGRGYMLRDG